MNKNLLRGVFLIAVALLFGAGSVSYRVGRFSQPGPGLFPLMVSVMLLAVGVATVVRSRFTAPVAMDFSLRNIAIILASLAGFALLTQRVNMIAGIVFLVFCSSLAATTRTLARNVKISLGLVAVAFAFQRLLGLNLPLY